MITKKKHTIKKCRIELMLGNERTAFDTQQRFLSTAKKMVAEKLEDLFDEVVGDNRYIKINKLEIDVGSIRETTMEEDVPDLMSALIEEELKKSISTSYNSAKPNNEYDNEAKDNSSNTQIYDRTQHAFARLDYFLKHGCLPWWATNIDFDSFEKETIYAFKEDHKWFSDNIKRTLKHGNILERLAYQFSEDFLVEFISILTSIKKRLIIETVDGLKKRVLEHREDISHGQFKKRVYLPILKALSLSNHVIDLPQDWLATITNQCSMDTSVLQEKSDASLSEKEKPQKAEIISENEDDFEYYVSNAGLVILAPFLPSFFKELKLLEGNDFRDEDARCRAAHILQYAINKAECAPENGFVLNKILCDIQVDKAIERDINLTDEEKDNVTDLLTSVVKHWSALKGSSVDSLREGFLQRDAKLIIVDNGWKLIVERKTMDILLTKIPWGFSMIKLPWMTSLVSVEW